MFDADMLQSYELDLIAMIDDMELNQPQIGGTPDPRIKEITSILSKAQIKLHVLLYPKDGVEG